MSDEPNPYAPPEDRTSDRPAAIGKRWWQVSTRELAIVASIMAFELAILVPAVVTARAAPKRMVRSRTWLPGERWLLHQMHEGHYSGWVYLLGAVSCGALAAGVVVLMAAIHRKLRAVREKIRIKNRGANRI